jgi:hypothetical protein
MTIIELGALGEFFGAILLFGSLIYVGIQIRQNTRAMRYQAGQILTDMQVRVNAMIAENSDLAEIIQRGSSGRDALSADEEFRFNAFWIAIYKQNDYSYHQYMAGQIDLVSWETLEREIPWVLGLPGTSEWWNQDKQRFSPEFSKQVDRILVDRKFTGENPTLGKAKMGAT